MYSPRNQFPAILAEKRFFRKAITLHFGNLDHSSFVVNCHIKFLENHCTISPCLVSFHIFFYHNWLVHQLAFGTLRIPLVKSCGEPYEP